MGSLPATNRLNVDSICIIGAGPSGLTAAKYLLAEKKFSRIVIYEQRSKVGGLWNYVPCSSTYAEKIAIPQTDPHAGLDEPIPHHANGCNTSTDQDRYTNLTFMSPIYDQLETNIPRGLMGFSDLDWPEDSQLFPKHKTVLEYIERYAAEVKHLIRFCTQVVDIRLRQDERWSVKTQYLSQDHEAEAEEETFDAILVANGHFNVPFIPSAPGIQAWNKTYPGSIIHSKFYRSPHHYTGKKVIVVGNSASGVDIAAQIATHGNLPLLQSQKSESYLQPNPTSTITPKPPITAFSPETRTIHFADSTFSSNIDSIVYCTGYFYSLPFLSSLQPPLVTSGERVEGTYQHIFYRPNPTLAFVVLNQKVIPFPLAEAQSAVIARVWSGRLELPGEGEMREWERRTMELAGEERGFHVLTFPRDAEYINRMYGWAMSAEGEGRKAGVGKVPPFWGEKEFWTRERFPAIKKTFQGFGEERCRKRTLESVGFDFEEWKGSTARQT